MPQSKHRRKPGARSIKHPGRVDARTAARVYDVLAKYKATADQMLLSFSLLLEGNVGGSVAKADLFAAVHDKIWTDQGCLQEALEHLVDSGAVVLSGDLISMSPASIDRFYATADSPKAPLPAV